jgi:hypothetical protein
MCAAGEAARVPRRGNVSATRSTQLWLFEPRRPLRERLGEDFFRAVPSRPGVYVMTECDGRVLYVGQSGNLRARLASYKNAQTGRVPRKLARLVSAVDQITWEVCDDAAAARLRENELLRLHRPRFNRLNVWPQGYGYLGCGGVDGGVRLAMLEAPTEELATFGAFKGGRWLAFGALTRLLLAVSRGIECWADIPSELFRVRSRRGFACELGGWKTMRDRDEVLARVQHYLAGESDSLLDWLRARLPPEQTAPRFMRTWLTADFDRLAAFYLTGPRRNRELRQAHGLAGTLIAPEELDDLLALRAPA